MNTLVTRYSSTLLPLAIGVLGILQAANAAGTGTLLDWQTLTQIGMLLATTGAVYWLPLVDAKWQGAAKTGAAIAGAILSALVAVVPDGHFTHANAILVLTAIVKAVATELGVQIRTDAKKTIDAGTVTAGAAAVITSVPAAAVPLSAADVVIPTPATLTEDGVPATFEEATQLATVDATADDAKHAAS